MSPRPQRRPPPAPGARGLDRPPPPSAAGSPTLSTLEATMGPAPPPARPTAVPQTRRPVPRGPPRARGRLWRAGAGEGGLGEGVVDEPAQGARGGSAWTPCCGSPPPPLRLPPALPLPPPGLGVSLAQSSADDPGQAPSGRVAVDAAPGAREGGRRSPPPEALSGGAHDPRRRRAAAASQPSDDSELLRDGLGCVGGSVHSVGGEQPATMAAGAHGRCGVGEGGRRGRRRAHGLCIVLERGRSCRALGQLQRHTREAPR